MRRIDKPLAKAFLDANHRLGDTTCRYRYGLFARRTTGSGEAGTAEGTLVAVATFSNARRWQKGDGKVSSYEWIRYASAEGYRVTGGMSKLLAAFVEEVHPDDVMSYADAGWPDGGEVYKTLGFVEECRVERAGHTDIKYRRTFGKVYATQ